MHLRSGRGASSASASNLDSVLLDRAASNIAEQNLEFSVSYDRDDELGHLASSFPSHARPLLVESQRAPVAHG